MLIFHVCKRRTANQDNSMSSHKASAPANKHTSPRYSIVVLSVGETGPSFLSLISNPNSRASHTEKSEVATNVMFSNSRDQLRVWRGKKGARNMPIFVHPRQLPHIRYCINVISPYLLIGRAGLWEGCHFLVLW